MHKLDNLKIWHKAIELATQVYEMTANFPNEERYNLTSQIRRSVVSIPSNIAEGAGRNTPKEFIHFLSIANGSSFELQTQLIIADKLNLFKGVSIEKILSAIDELQKMNYALQKSWK